MIEFHCPRCQAAMKVPESAIGTKIRCTSCAQKLLVPDPIDVTMKGDVPRQASPVAKGEEWYYTRKGKKQPAVRWVDIQRMVRTGELSGSDLVWTHGMSAWKPVRAMPELKALIDENREEREALAHTEARLWEGMGVALYSLVGCAILGVLLYFLLPVIRKGSDRARDAANKGGTEEVKELKPQEVFASCSPAVARVQNRFGTGSGFLIRPKTLVTNAHVIAWDRADQLKVTFPSAGDPKRSFKATVLYEDRQRDLAILHVDTDLSPLEIAPLDPQVGQQITVIGSPATGIGNILENTATTGNLGTLLQHEGMSHYHITAPINGGNSGGPVIDSYGRVVGVVTWKIVKQGHEGQAFAIPYRDVTAALEKIADPKRPRLNAERDVLEVYHRGAELTAIYEEVMRLDCQRRMYTERKETPPEELRLQIGSLFNKIDSKKPILKVLRPEMREIARNAPTSLAEAQLIELWSVYDEMARECARPMTRTEFEQTTGACTQRRKQSLEMLSKFFGKPML